MKLRINPRALKDLQSIKSYIEEELHNPNAALGTIQNIISSYKHLAEFPMMGKSLADVIDIPTDYRFLVSGDYFIFYKVEGNYISVHRVFSHRQDFIRILFEK